MSLIAGQWGDSAPAGATVTVPALNAFLQSILVSDAIQPVSQMVQVRNNLGQPVEQVTLQSVVNFFGGNVALIPQEPNNIANLAFEVLITLNANHGPVSVEGLNAAEFIASWQSALKDSTGAAMQALITTSFPGVNYGVYVLNKELYQAQSGAASAQVPGQI